MATATIHDDMNICRFLKKIDKYKNKLFIKSYNDETNNCGMLNICGIGGERTFIIPLFDFGRLRNSDQTPIMIKIETLANIGNNQTMWSKLCLQLL